MISALAATALLGPQLTRLPNGIPVIVDTGGKDLVTIQVLVRTDDLPPLEAGAAETMAHALFGETENYSLRELQRLAWTIGGAVAAESAGDCIRLQVTTTRNRLRPAAAFISDALRRPAFTQVSLDEARKAAIHHRDWLNRTPPLADVFSHQATKTVGPLFVPNLTPDQAHALHAKVVRPERVAIAVVGDVDADTVATALGASLGHWRGEDAAPISSLLAVKDSPESAFKTSLVTVPGPHPKDAGFAAWLVACVAVAEGKGSALNREFRVSRGAAYVLGSYLTFRKAASYCTFYVSSTNEIRNDELNGLVASFAPDERAVDRAKAFLVGRYAVGGPTEVGRFGAFSIGHETDAARAFWLAWWDLKGAGFGRDDVFPSLVQKVSLAQVTEATRKWPD